MEISKGNIIKIGKDKFDVLTILKEIDKYDTQKNEFIGEHTEIELHKHGSRSLHPTHLLKLYYDDEHTTVLFKIVYEKAPKEIKKPKQRGHIFNYVNKKAILKDQIKIIS